MGHIIGVIGVGFVGQAVKSFFEEKAFTVLAYDKYKDGFSSFENVVKNSSIIFLCLPTPYIKDFGYDLSALHEVCAKLRARYIPIIIKSTVEPGTTENLAKVYNIKNLIHNPEFLTQRTALEDFRNQKKIFLGYSKADSDLFTIRKLYQDCFPEAEIIEKPATETEAIKLFCNSFYAAKVQIFTEFYLLCQRLNIDFNSVKDGMLENGWINKMHTNIPGPDGNISYSGHCFPKDIGALNSLMDRYNVPHEVLIAALSERDKLRKD